MSLSQVLRAQVRHSPVPKELTHCPLGEIHVPGGPLVKAVMEKAWNIVDHRNGAPLPD